MTRPMNDPEYQEGLARVSGSHASHGAEKSSPPIGFDPARKCLPFFHDWPKWSKIVVNPQGDALQGRYCERCGKGQVRWVS